MRTFCLSLAIIILLPLFAVAQKHKNKNPNLPSFGEIDKSDLQMISCDFDSSANADAEILVKRCDVSFDGKPSGMDDIQFVLKQQWHERIKILKQNGIDEQANIKIPYSSKDEKMESVKAETFNLDEQGNVVITPLEKKQIYFQKVDKDETDLVFSLPNVKVGSVIEYEYTRVSENFFRIPTWYFQSDIPSRYSYIQLHIPDMFNYVNEGFYSLPLDINTSDTYRQNFISGYTANGAVRTFAMKNIPALHDEPFMTAKKDYLQRIIFQLASVKYPDYEKDVMGNWDKLISDLMENEYFGLQLDKHISGTKDFIKAISILPDKKERMFKIYDYVRSNMEWDGNNGIGVDDNVNKVWEKRTGSVGEINIILINLLRDAGLDAYPLLVSTRGHGKVNPAYPFIGQFNQTVAYVWADNRNYILDATEKDLPYNLVPVDILNTDGYLISPDLKGWIAINEKYLEYKNQVSMMASITPDGLLKGQAYIYSYDYSRTNRLKTWKNDKQDYKKEYLLQDNATIKIDSMKILNAENDSLPLEQIANFTMPLSNSGNYLYFNTNLFTGLSTNPFVTKQRFSDVDFGFNQSYSFTGAFSLPKGYQLQELPKNIMLIMPDTSIVFRRIMVADAHTLSVRFSVNFKRPFFAREEYTALQDFYKKLFAKLDEQIVLAKNSPLP